MKSWKIINRLVFLALIPALGTAVFLTAYYTSRIINDLDDALVGRGNTITKNLTSTLQSTANPIELRVIKNLVDQTLRETDVIGVEIRDARGDMMYRNERPDVMYSRPNSILQQLSNLIFNTRTLSFSRKLIPKAVHEHGDASTPGIIDKISNDAETRIGSIRVVLSTQSSRYRELVVAVKGIGIVLVILGVFSLFAFHVGRSMSKPIEAMLKTMGSIQNGNLDSSIEVTAGGEFGVLQQGINLMVEKIRVSHEHLVRSVKLATVELRRKIDEINRKNREMEIARSRAEEANIAKSRFLANMSHELRTPMNAIIGFTDLLCEYRVDDVHDDYTSTIRRSAADLLILINEILDYSKIESGELKIEKTEFNFYRLIDGIVALLSNTAYEKDLEFFTYIDPDIPVDLVTDPLRLKQSVINLLSNAIKFTDRGYVALEIHRRNCDGTRDESYLEFRVIDTGIGIDDCQATKIFEPFAQADDSLTRAHGGTGLGLSITKYFVDKLDGSIGYTSRSGGGSTFWFTWPFSAPDAKLYHQTETLPPLATLLYDQQPARAAYTEALLRAWGLSVTRTHTMEAFVRRCKDTHYKLILYYVNSTGVDTDLQISINQLATSQQAAKFFMHRHVYYENMSSATGFVHMSSLISPHQLYAQISVFTLRSEPDQRAHTNLKCLPPVGIMEDLAGLKILIADDNNINQHLLQVYVARNNGETIIASDGQEAIELFERFKPEAIIMDVHMPIIDGIEAMRTIKARSPETPIISVTADASPEKQEWYRETGFDDCLTKPITERSLLEAIHYTVKKPPAGPELTSVSVSNRNNGQASAELPIIDVDKAIKISGGNRDLAKELFTMLLVDLRTNCSQLVLDDIQGLEQLKGMTHKIRGGAKYCAAERIQYHAARLEDTINEQAGGMEVASSLERLTRAINELLSFKNPFGS